jgi:predicted DNA-binding protein
MMKLPPAGKPFLDNFSKHHCKENTYFVKKAPPKKGLNEVSYT